MSTVMFIIFLVFVVIRWAIMIFTVKNKAWDCEWMVYSSGVCAGLFGGYPFKHIVDWVILFVWLFFTYLDYRYLQGLKKLTQTESDDV